MQRRFIHRAAISAVAGLAALSLAACSSAGSADATGDEGNQSDNPNVVVGFYGGQELSKGEPVSGGHLSYGLTIPVPSVDPTGIIGGAGGAIGNQVFDALLRADAEGVVQPSLATGMTSEDGQKWTMTLEEGVQFSDGTPFNADAVMTHLTNIAAEGSMSLSAGEARAITSMNAPDDYTIEFELEAPNASFALNFTDGSMSMIPSPTAKAALGDQFGLKPVGAGPFVVTSFEPNGTVEFERNESYWMDGLPYLDSLTMTPVLESSARLAALQSGDLDVASFRNANDASEAETAGLTVLEQQWFSVQMILPNTTRAPFDDARVREAANLAVDYAAINKVAAGAEVTDLPGILVPNHPAYDAETAFPDFNPEKATELIEEYEAETGNTVSFEVLHAQDPALTQGLALVQQMYSDVGIDMTTSVAVPNIIVGSALSGEADAVVIESGLPPETLRRAAQTLGTEAGQNWGRGGTAEMDALLEQALTVDEADRADLIQEIQEVGAEWMPFVHVLGIDLYRVANDRVGGFPDGVSNPNSFDWFEAKYAWVEN